MSIIFVKSYVNLSCSRECYENSKEIEKNQKLVWKYGNFDEELNE